MFPSCLPHYVLKNTSYILFSKDFKYFHAVISSLYYRKVSGLALWEKKALEFESQFRPLLSLWSILPVNLVNI